jgi:2-dehydropantoate 2-reductase
MRQVPTYLLIGSGRVATHFRCYFKLLQLPFQSWSRQENSPQSLASLSENCSSILLLISDKAIPAFLEQYPFLKGRNLVHFSGCLSVPGVHSAHPLMTFVPELYDLATYSKTPFILAEEGPDLSSLLPGIPNPSYRISEASRPYYHALCVLSGNFTALLWQKFFKEITGRFQLPQEVAYPYLKQVADNLMSAAPQALTGPLVRGDQATIAANLEALDGDQYQIIYQAFVEAYQHPSRGK